MTVSIINNDPSHGCRLGKPVLTFQLYFVKLVLWDNEEGKGQSVYTLCEEVNVKTLGLACRQTFPPSTHTPLGGPPMNQSLQWSGVHHMILLVHRCRLLLETCGATERSLFLESGLLLLGAEVSRCIQKSPSRY